MGPLLFLIYINDLPNISEIFKFYLFADDTNIYYEADNLQKLERVVNKELKWLNHWLNVNRLSLNIDKTNFVIFHPFNKPLKQHITLKINKRAIGEEKYVKYLGVLIDSTLSWNAHIDNLSKKIARSLGVMFKIRPLVTPAILKNIYYSLVYPHLLYAIQVWGSAFDTNLNKLIVLQKKIVRMMTFNENPIGIRGPSAHTSPLFNELSILKLKDIYDLQLLRFVHDCFNRISPRQFHSWFKLITDNHNHATRSNTVNIVTVNNEATLGNNLLVPYARTSYYGQRSIKVKGARQWNRIPHNIRTIQSRIVFSKAMKRHYLLLH